MSRYNACAAGSKPCIVGGSLEPGYVFLEPSVQYVINPSNVYNPTARDLNDDGLVVALQFGIDLGKALGLSAPD